MWSCRRWWCGLKCQARELYKYRRYIMIIALRREMHFCLYDFVVVVVVVVVATVLVAATIQLNIPGCLSHQAMFSFLRIWLATSNTDTLLILNGQASLASKVVATATTQFLNAVAVFLVANGNRPVRSLHCCDKHRLVHGRSLGWYCSPLN